ncbi:MAG: twin-arginine translocation signal domain-containing protein [Eggerthellaceae bacterium]|nr:twin-arginine translocation signal domain-containing protein [Eggerthellaceae bacterium]
MLKSATGQGISRRSFLKTTAVTAELAFISLHTWFPERRGPHPSSSFALPPREPKGYNPRRLPPPY